MRDLIIGIWLVVLTVVNAWLAWLFHDNGLF